MKNRYNHIHALWGFLPVLIFLILWETAGRCSLFPGQFYFPPFTEVLKEFYLLSANGILGKNFASSLVRVLAGLCSGSLTGIFMGILMGWRKAMNRTFHPIISLLYPIPALGWLPLLMLWIGINELLPITVIFICSFFPVVYNTSSGIRNVDKKYILAAETLGASNIRILFTVIVPLALPSIFTGLKLEAGMSWRVLIAAEMIAIPTGIGALLIQAENLVRIDIIMVCLIVLSIMCFLFEKAFAIAEKRMVGKWSGYA